MKDIDSSLYKVPPQNLEAEQAVLGGILLDNQAINAVIEQIGGDDFYSESHRKLFSAILELNGRNEPCDLITLSEALRQRNHLESIGGVTYLATLVENIPSAANIAHYARIVKQKSILRRLIGTATEILTKSYSYGSDIDDLLDEAERSIFEISQNKIKPAFFPLKELLKDSFRTIERLYEKKDLITGVPTGFKEVDDLTSGLQRADLVIVAGRPSMGKTAFALNIAQYAAIEAEVPVAVFSLEMSKEQIAMRLLTAEARVDSQRIRKGFLRESDWPKLTDAVGRLADARVYIDDTPSITVLEMKAKARRLKAENGLGLVILDYLQLMKGSSSSDSREQEISEISRSLKALAKELDIPVVALSQLNRRVEDRPHKRPQMADLRESGAIEQDADVIMFLYRDEVYNKSEDNENKGFAEVLIEKQRNGPTGKVLLKFMAEFTRFENPSLQTK